MADFLFKVPSIEGFRIAYPIPYLHSINLTLLKKSYLNAPALDNSTQ